MNLPFEQDDVGIYTVMVFLEASYRRARCELSDELYDSLIEFSGNLSTGD